MQSVYSTFPGELRNDVTIAIVGDDIGPDEVLIDFPMAQVQAGIGPGRISIPVNELIVCAKSDHYFFAAQAKPTSVNATLHQIDLTSVTYKKIVLPNSRTQVLSHIQSVDPEARERDPFMLTGDGKVMMVVGKTLGFGCVGISGLCVAVVIIAITLHTAKKRRSAVTH